MSVFTATATGVRVSVRATPKANADAVEGVVEDSAGGHHLKVRVRAAPEDGHANAAIEALLADFFGAAKRAVRVVKGGTGRMKVVDIEGVTAAAATARIKQKTGRIA